MGQSSTVSSTSRREVLDSLINFNIDLEAVKIALAKFAWDSPEEVTLKTKHIQSILERFIHRDLSSVDVENWANLVEGREDIAYDEQDKSTLKQLVFELANPILAGALDHQRAENLLGKLGRSE